MSTKSYVGMCNIDGTVDYIYVHYDGYVKGLGKTLFYYYKTPEQVENLISMGDASSIRNDIESSEFYGRDFGERDVDFSTSRSVDAFLSHIPSDIDFVYLYDTDKKAWLFAYEDEDEGYWELEPLSFFVRESYNKVNRTRRKRTF